eukprot:5823201-Pyramimonas_sp.AAC.1
MEQALLPPERDGWCGDFLCSTEDGKLLGSPAARSLHGDYHDHCEDDGLLRSRARHTLAGASSAQPGAEGQLHAAGYGRAASRYHPSFGAVPTGSSGPASCCRQR